MILLNISPQPFTEAKAREVADQLNADQEDDWTYKVKIAEKIEGPCPAVIEVYDEDGEFVTLWTAS